MYSLAIGLVTRTNPLWAEINSVLRDLPFRVVSDIHATKNRELSLAQIEKSAPDIVVAEISDDVEQGRELIASIKRAAPMARIVAVHSNPGLDMVVTAMRMGANEFVHAPVAENIREFLDRAQASFDCTPQGIAVGFVSAKGGCGSSTIACHTAVALGARASKAGKRSLLMDLDLNTGVDRFILKAPGEYSVVDAVKNFQKLDVSYWNSLVAKSHTGLDVLASPTQLRTDQEFKLDEIQYVLSFARRYYDRVILDLGRGVGQIAKAILPQVSELYVIATNEIIPLYMTQQMVKALDDAAYPRDRVRLILNRLPRTGRGEIRDLEKALGMPITYSLPNDYEELRECYSSGKLLPEGSSMAKAIRSLVGRMVGEPIPEQPNVVKRLLQKYTNADEAFEAHQTDSSSAA